jgi:hypothetical protein
MLSFFPHRPKSKDKQIFFSLSFTVAVKKKKKKKTSCSSYLHGHTRSGCASFELAKRLGNFYGSKILTQKTYRKKESNQHGNVFFIFQA